MRWIPCCFPRLVRGHWSARAQLSRDVCRTCFPVPIFTWLIGPCVLPPERIRAGYKHKAAFLAAAAHTSVRLAPLCHQVEGDSHGVSLIYLLGSSINVITFLSRAFFDAVCSPDQSIKFPIPSHRVADRLGRHAQLAGYVSRGHSLHQYHPGGSLSGFPCPRELRKNLQLIHGHLAQMISFQAATMSRQLNSFASSVNASSTSHCGPLR